MSGNLSDCNSCHCLRSGTLLLCNICPLSQMSRNEMSLSSMNFDNTAENCDCCSQQMCCPTLCEKYSTKNRYQRYACPVPVSNLSAICRTVSWWARNHGDNKVTYVGDVLGLSEEQRFSSAWPVNNNQQRCQQHSVVTDNILLTKLILKERYSLIGLKVLLNPNQSPINLETFAMN